MDSHIICRRLAQLAGFLQELEQLTAGVDEQSYAQNLQVRRAVERQLQLIVECATDANAMTLKHLKQAPASDYFNTFINLAECGVLPEDFALQLAASTGLRNILVHEYQRVDDRIVYQSISKTLLGYRRYLRLMIEYLDC